MRGDQGIVIEIGTGIANIVERRTVVVEAASGMSKVGVGGRKDIAGNIVAANEKRHSQGRLEWFPGWEMMRQYRIIITPKAKQ